MESAVSDDRGECIVIIKYCSACGGVSVGFPSDRLWVCPYDGCNTDLTDVIGIFATPHEPGREAVEEILAGIAEHRSRQSKRPGVVKSDDASHVLI